LETAVPEENFHTNHHPESHVTEYFDDCFQRKLATDRMAVSLKSFPANREILFCQDLVVWHVMRAWNQEETRNTKGKSNDSAYDIYPAIPLTLLKPLVMSTDSQCSTARNPK
jgi:hypothetical protein